MSCPREAALSSSIDALLKTSALLEITPSLRIRDQLKVCLRFSLKA